MGLMETMRMKYAYEQSCLEIVGYLVEILFVSILVRYLSQVQTEMYH